jgi:hypothetical protein
MTTIADMQAMTVKELQELRATKAKDDEFFIYCIDEIIKSKVKDSSVLKGLLPRWKDIERNSRGKTHLNPALLFIEELEAITGSKEDEG